VALCRRCSARPPIGPNCIEYQDPLWVTNKNRCREDPYLHMDESQSDGTTTRSRGRAT